MKLKWKIILTVFALAFAQFLIVVGPKVNAVKVSGVGLVVWQEGKPGRWIIFPGEKCSGE